MANLNLFCFSGENARIGEPIGFLLGLLGIYYICVANKVIKLLINLLPLYQQIFSFFLNLSFMNIQVE